jgi:hypothetical protein
MGKYPEEAVHSSKGQWLFYKNAAELHLQAIKYNR